MMFLSVRDSDSLSGDNSHSSECILRSTPLNTSVANGLIAVPLPAEIPLTMSGAIFAAIALARNWAALVPNEMALCILATSPKLSRLRPDKASTVFAPNDLAILSMLPGSLAACAAPAPKIPSSSPAMLILKES